MLNQPAPEALEEKRTVVSPSEPPRRKSPLLFLVFLLAAAALAYGIYNGIRERQAASSVLANDTRELSIPAVATVHPKKATGGEEILIPGNMQAFIDTPIWARSSGYLKTWTTDIGARVTKGALLATIEAPELDHQLQQARADLATADANLKLAEVTAERYTNLFKTDSVAKQDVDNAVQAAAARTAAVTSAQANVSRLEQLVSYERVVAPFDGVLTARNVDVGALVDAGANAPGKELFRLASVSTLRVYVSIPETYSQAAKSGLNATLTLTEFPGRVFHGVLVRNANAIDAASRTLLVEVDVKNPTGELLPGSYAIVHLKLPGKVPVLTVPGNALLFRAEGLRVATVESGHTNLKPIVMGRDLGDEVEIASGLSEEDTVIVNPSDSIAAGDPVQIATPHGKKP